MEDRNNKIEYCNRAIFLLMLDFKTINQAMIANNKNNNEWAGAEYLHLLNDNDLNLLTKMLKAKVKPHLSTIEEFKSIIDDSTIKDIVDVVSRGKVLVEQYKTNGIDLSKTYAAMVRNAVEKALKQ